MREDRKGPLSYMHTTYICKTEDIYIYTVIELSGVGSVQPPNSFSTPPVNSMKLPVGLS